MLKRPFMAIALLAFSMILVSGCAAQNKAGSATTKPYMLSTCLVSGEPLGSMGDPVVYMHNGQEIKFCCSNCEGAFKKEPEKYTKQLEEASKSPTTKPGSAG